MLHLKVVFFCRVHQSCSIITLGAHGCIQEAFKEFKCFLMYLNFDRALEIMATIYKIRAQLDKGENSRVYLIGQNFSTNKIFDTKPKFQQFCPIFA